MITKTKYIISRFGGGSKKAKQIELEYQDALNKAYKSLDRESLKLVLIDLMSQAGMADAIKAQELDPYKLIYREAARSLVHYIMNKLELSEFEFLEGLGGSQNDR